MKRDLLKQFFNEWSDNVWLIVEFLVVLLTIWAIVAYTMSVTAPLKQPIGISPENIFEIKVKKISGNSPQYVAGEDGSETYISDRNELMRRLKDNEFVEYVAIHSNGLPYSFSSYNTELNPFDWLDSIPYRVNIRRGSYELPQVLKLEPIDGSSLENMAEVLKSGDVIISSNLNYEKQGRDPIKFKGHRVVDKWDSIHPYKVGGVVRTIKRGDYEENRRGIMYVPLDLESDWADLIALRVKPGARAKFKEAFNTDYSLRRAGNVYLTDMISIEEMHSNNSHSKDMEVRLMIVCIFFLIVTILLGLLGTFWFRVQQRVSEIAIRKVCGATNMQVFRRLLGEGFIIFGCAAVLSIVCVWPFYKKVLTFVDLGWTELLIAEIIALVICAFGLFISLFAPARRVMRIEPALAIKEE